MWRTGSIEPSNFRHPPLLLTGSLRAGAGEYSEDAYDDTLYFLRHNQNIPSRLEPESGKPRGEPLRLEGIRDIFAWPVGTAGRIYITGRAGVTLVLRHDRENATLALNRLDDTFSASPALVDRELYLRGERFLYCIAEPGTP